MNRLEIYLKNIILKILGWAKSSLRFLLNFGQTNKNAMLNLSINDISGHSLPPYLFPLSSLISQILCFDFNWRTFASQCCGSLCHTSRQISHNYIYIYILPLDPLTPPQPSRSSQRARLGSPCYRAASR